MSQVNDALKRIRDTQQGAPRTADAPALRSPTAAPTPAPARGIGLILPIIFAVVALVGLVSLILLWQLRQKQTAPLVTMKPAPASMPMQAASVAVARPALATPAAAKASTGKPMAAAQAAAVPAPGIPMVKLQGILYTSHGSTAVISGQTVVAGDEVGGYRVAAIGEHSVTLVNGTRTNVLTLGR